MPPSASLGELLVGRLLFVEGLLQEVGRFGVTHGPRPRHQRAVGRHLVVLGTLTRRNQAGVHRVSVEVLFHDRLAFFDDARDPVAVLAAHLLIEALEDLFQAFDLTLRFREMRFEGLAQCGCRRRFGQLRRAPSSVAVRRRMCHAVRR